MVRFAAIASKHNVATTTPSMMKYVRRGTLLEPAGTFAEQVAFDGLPGVAVDLGPVWEP